MLDECYKALTGMAHRKAPGLDDFPMEFYVKFWSVLGSDLVDVLNSCYHSVFVSLSVQRYYYLTFKKGERLDAGNWRLISLLNVDFKIAAGAIAGWLLKVIHLVVAKDQTCGVPDRYIWENVAFLWDVSYATTFDSRGAILSLDQEKAFDRVDWGFMLSTLRTMGLGLLLSTGFVCFTRMFRVLSMLMVAYLFFLCLVVSIKAVVCAVFRSSTCRSQRLSGWARGRGFLTLQWILIGLQLRSRSLAFTLS